MNGVALVTAILRADALRWRLLEIVRDLNLPDGWIGAGFIRNAVWDHLHGRAPSPPSGDVDVIWYDPHRNDAARDARYEAALRTVDSSIAWSVKNQARMHSRNGDRPYKSATDAMRFWPETATAIAVRRSENDDVMVAAPFGFDDLLQLILQPTPRFRGEKRAVFEDRLHSKAWVTTWPLLRAADATGSDIPPSMETRSSDMPCQSG